MTRFVSHYLPPIAYATAILIVSSIPRLDTPDLGVTFLDKIFHGIEYMILAALVLRAAKARSSEAKTPKLIILSLTICLVFSAFDEYHQSFIPGRFADVFDFVADAAGIGLGGLVYSAFRRFKKLG